MLLSELARTLESGAPSEDFRPCFIVGCQRSGTTLLAVMLDRHSEIAVPPETNFMEGMRRGGEGGNDRERMLQQAFSMTETEDLHLDRDAVAARFGQRPPGKRELLRAMLEEYAATRGKPRVGEKTPYHLWYVPELLAWYPHARVIGIVRDGRDVVRSILQAPWTSQRSLRANCLKWIRSARQTEKLVTQFPDRFKLIRYEDLVSEPEQTLRSIAQFIGLEFEEAQLEPQPSETIASWEEPWKRRATDAPDASAVGKWKQEATAHERLVLTLMMKPELERMGYADTELPTCSAARLGWEKMLNAIYRSGLYRLWYKVAGKHLLRKHPHRNWRWAGRS